VLLPEHPIYLCHEMQRMKRSACVVLLLFFFRVDLLSQSSSTTLDVVSWNIEWFGSNTQGQGPPDANLQEANVRSILKALNADIYGLVEVVDTVRIRRVRDSLGNNFELVISPFCSNNTTGTGTSWLTGQKLAFIYNKNIFSNVIARGLMRSSATAYYNYASGRFPYMLSANATINGVTKAMNFILIHGKAGSTTTDYSRRLDGAQELKDTLDLYYSNAINIIIGDYNDALDTTICTACSTTLSSFDPIVKDSVDADHYKSLTLPLALSGQTSMTNFPSVVDNHIISNEAAPLYVQNSVRIATEVVNMVPFYGSTTSDHYPVFSQYSLNGLPTAIAGVNQTENVKVFPNPASGLIFMNAPQDIKQARISVYAIDGRMLKQFDASFIPRGQHALLSVADLNPGFYFLQIQSSRFRQVIQFIRK
jgi:trimeric autotransporter adhesin